MRQLGTGRSIAVLLCAMLCAAAVAGCAALDLRPGAPSSDATEAVRLEVPFVKQALPSLCGVAALTMLTRYHGRLLSREKHDAVAASASLEKGASGAVLKSALESEGYLVGVFAGTADDGPAGLYRHLRRGRPLIAMLSMGEYRHYVVVVGFDSARDALVVLDPVSGTRSMRTRRFVAMWEKANRFTLLAVPRGPAAG